MELLLSFSWLGIVGLLIYRAFQQRGLLQVVDPAPAPDGSVATVALVVPVRNEAANIRGCLEHLARQTYPFGSMRIVVVDDHSSDETTAIVTDLIAGSAGPRIELLRSPALPPNWIGKSHACWVGAKAVSHETEWLCFLDADVVAQPALIASAMQAAASARVDLLSLAPRQELVSFAERLMMPCGLFLLAFVQDLRRKQSPDALEDVTATGQFLLARRCAYEAVGGHAAVAAEICEDLELARLLKRSGFTVVLRDGERLLSVRMYRNWRTLWSGLAKNLVDTLGGPARTVASAFGAVVLAWLALLAPALAAHGCLLAKSGACLALSVAGAGSAAAFALHIAGATHFGIPFWYALLFPAGYTAGALIALDSVRRRCGGRVSWKGRSYPAGNYSWAIPSMSLGKAPADRDDATSRSSHRG